MPANASSSESSSALPSYSARIEAVRKVWSGHSCMVIPEPESEEEDIGLGSHRTSSKTSTLLPWHTGHSKLAVKNQRILDGYTAASGKVHKPLDQGSFIQRVKFRDRSYVVAQEAPLEAVPVPENFSSIQYVNPHQEKKGNKPKPPKVEISLSMAREIESQLRRLLRIDSYQEWFLGTARDLVESSQKDPSTGAVSLPTAIGLLVSGIRALKDGNQVATQLLHNMVLLRRDTHLGTLSRDVPKELRRRLRRHSLGDSEHLFSPADIDDAKKATMEARQVAVITTAAKNLLPGQSSSRPRQQSQKGNSPREHQPQQRSQSFSPRQRTPWKGKGSPKGKTPFKPKRGGNSDPK